MCRVPSLFFVLLLLLSCRDFNAPTAPEAAIPLENRLLQLDADPTFYFLPPIGKAREPGGTFNASLSPVVQICRGTAVTCASSDVVTTFTTTSEGADRIRVVDGDTGHYHVNWHTLNFSLDPSETYRISVFLAVTELGHADVDLVASGRELASVDRTRFIPLLNGRTLPIKFRIERVDTLPDRLQGKPTAPAAPAIPDREFVPSPVDYSDSHPELGDVFISYNTILLVFEPETTVAEANAVLERLDAEIVGGIPGTVDVPGILALRVPTTSHEELIQILDSLRRDPRVRHVVQDVLLEGNVLPRIEANVFTQWMWEAIPQGGNWGLEASRVPQMWNLYAGIRKAGATPPQTAVLDLGFDDDHPDLNYAVNLTPAVQDTHGTHVAGIIGAVFDNGQGIEGLNPFAQLVVRAGTFTSRGSITAIRTSWGSEMIFRYFDLVVARRDIRVVNTSLGYNWAQSGINSDTSTAAQKVANDQGAILNVMQLLVSGVRPLPVWVTSAGNDGNRDARFNSPMANAALVQGNANIIVVESVALTGTGAIVRSGFSQVNGHISAPGSQIFSTILEGYNFLSGTSMATPHVAGLVGYLYTLETGLPDPTLTTNPIRDLLLRYAVLVAGGAQPRIDAFATAMAVDSVRGNDRVLRMLVDIDDGTPDGNQRTDPRFSGDFREEDADGDGGPGDGAVDMSDFRRWRDWFLQVTNPQGLSLDGSVAHPKKDPNGDGRRLETPAQENVYPRGDFNGDGRISRFVLSPVPGFGAVTDLQVLQRAFQDPHYLATDLDGLILSGDLVVSAQGCLARSGVVQVRSSIRFTGQTTPQQSRTHDAATTVHIYTAPVGFGGPARYTVRVDGLDANGVLVGTEERVFDIWLGSDFRWEPTCGHTLLLDDEFDTENDGFPELNYTGFRTWDVTRGAVDLIGGPNDNVHDFYPGNGLYVDLDGSTFSAGRLESKTTFSLEPGTYVLEFTLGGSQRFFLGESDTVEISLGTLHTETISLPADEPLTFYERTITVSEAISGKIVFDHRGGDNVGIILAHVRLTRRS